MRTNADAEQSGHNRSSSALWPTRTALTAMLMFTKKWFEWLMRNEHYEHEKLSSLIRMSVSPGLRRNMRAMDADDASRLDIARRPHASRNTANKYADMEVISLWRPSGSSPRRAPAR